MEILQACVPSFARHESFHLRYGWLKKAYDQVVENEAVFVNARATVLLGVGKNMVRAIRFWGLASKLFEDMGQGRVRPTAIGRALLDDEGHDPHLERIETLWLLHWLLLSSPCRLPAWWIIMNEFSTGTIPVNELKKSVELKVTRIDEWSNTSTNSIERDVNAFIRTYAAGRGKISMEEYLDCPLRRLGLLRREADSLRFSYGIKDGLSPGIISCASADYARKAGIASGSIPVSRLAEEPGSVGAVFKMGEDDIAALLQDAAGFGVAVENVGGAQHLQYERDGPSMETMLKSVYLEATPA